MIRWVAAVVLWGGSALGSLPARSLDGAQWERAHGVVLRLIAKTQADSPELPELHYHLMIKYLNRANQKADEERVWLEKAVAQGEYLERTFPDAPQRHEYLGALGMGWSAWVSRHGRG